LQAAGVGIDEGNEGSVGWQDAHDFVEDEAQSLVRVLGVADQARDMVKRVEYDLGIVSHGEARFLTEFTELTKEKRGSWRG
jgi:hypothetical protein